MQEKSFTAGHEVIDTSCTERKKAADNVDLFITLWTDDDKSPVRPDGDGTAVPMPRLRIGTAIKDIRNSCVHAAGYRNPYKEIDEQTITW